MAGMAMGGQAPPAAGGAVTGLPAGSPGWTGTACLVLAAAFFAAAAWQAVSALRPLAVPDHGSADAPRHSIASAVLRDGTGALMAASMAVALLEMT